jgi:hypothetical protein
VIDDCLTTQQMGEFWYKFRGGATYIFKSVVSEFRFAMTYVRASCS